MRKAEMSVSGLGRMRWPELFLANSLSVRLVFSWFRGATTNSAFLQRRLGFEFGKRRATSEVSTSSIHRRLSPVFLARVPPVTLAFVNVHTRAAIYIVYKVARLLH